MRHHQLRGPGHSLAPLLIGVSLFLAGCLPPGEATAPPLPAVEQPAPANRSAGAAVPAASAAETPAWVSEFAAWLENEIDGAEIPGAALGVVRADGTVLNRGYGLRDVARKLPATPETLFHIGSTHKSLNALLIATLVDEGVLAWGAPVIRYDPDFALSDPAARATVSLRHLLSMTSGIPDEAEDDMPDDARAADVYPVVAKAELLGEPGEVFSYSNLSASLAGYTAVLATGGSRKTLFDDYSRLLEARLLRPLGMTTSTIYASQARRNPNRSLSYYAGDDGPEEAEAEDADGDALAPSGSLKSNVVEMGYYLRTLLRGGIAPDGTRLVSAEGLAELWRPQLEEYGLGWEIQPVDGGRLISHTGAYDNFVSVIALLPEAGYGFVLLVNSEDAGLDLTEIAAARFAEFYSEGK